MGFWIFRKSPGDRFFARNKQWSFLSGNYFKVKDLQGDPNQNPLFQMAVPIKLRISDPKLVKPKCVWEAVVFFEKL